MGEKLTHYLSWPDEKFQRESSGLASVPLAC